MPAVRTLGDRRNGGVTPTAHVPLFPTTRTVRHSRRTAYRCKIKGNNCVKRILCYLAQLRPFLYVLFGQHCDCDHDEGLRATVQPPVSPVCKDPSDQSHLSVRTPVISLTCL